MTLDGTPVVRGPRGKGPRSKRARLLREAPAVGATKRRNTRRRKVANAAAIEARVAYRITP